MMSPPAQRRPVMPGSETPANGPAVVDRIARALENRYVIERELGRGGMVTV